MHVCYECKCATLVHVEIRGQLGEVGFLLQPLHGLKIKTRSLGWYSTCCCPWIYLIVPKTHAFKS